jgi:hypothetical protein
MLTLDRRMLLRAGTAAAGAAALAPTVAMLYFAYPVQRCYRE